MKKRNSSGRMGFEAALSAILVGSLGAAQMAGQAEITDPQAGNLGDDVISRPEVLGTPTPEGPRGVTPGGFAGNLAGDLHGPRGVVFDGGTILIDLGGQPGLSIGVQVEPIDGRPNGVTKPKKGPKHVVLAGGTPGNGGVIVASPQLSGGKGFALGSQVIKGVFGLDGSFVAELPSLENDLFLQGFEVSAVSTSATEVVAASASGSSASEWDSSPLASDIQRAIRQLNDGDRSRIRFLGSAQLDELSGWVDFTAEIGPKQGGIVLVLEGDLLPLAGLAANTEDGRAMLHLAGPRDLVEAIEAAAMLDAFADLGDRHHAALGQLAAQRLLMRLLGSPGRGDQGAPETGSADSLGGISGKPQGVRPPQVHIPAHQVSGGTLLDGGTLVVGGAQEIDNGPVAGDPDPIGGRPNGVRPEDQSQSHAGDVHVYDGLIQEGGEVVVHGNGLPTFGGAQALPGRPQGTRPPRPQSSMLDHGSAFDGNVLDGGSITVDIRSGPNAGAPGGSVGDAGSVTSDAALNRRFEHTLDAVRDLEAASKKLESLRALLQRSL